jgi:signal transduction histidine kinase
MSLRDWLRPPRYTLPLFLAVILGPAAVLIWLGWRLLDLDQALARQQVQDRLEHAADLIAAGMERELDGIADRLPALLTSPAASLSTNGALVVALTSLGVDARAGAPLLYVPTARSDAELPASTWLPGELFEFRDGNYAKAASAFRALAESRNQQIRAGALVRLARNLRKADQPIEALEAYRALIDLGDVPLGGEPAALVACQARCRLLEELGRVVESRQQAASVLADLGRGRWPMERAGFLFHWQQAEQCAGIAASTGTDRRDGLALAAGIETLWREWRGRSRSHDEWRGRRSLWIEDRGVLLVWRASADRLIAFAAGSEYVTAEWARVWANQQIRVTLIDSEGHRVLTATPPSGGPEAARMWTDTKLPWTLRIASAEPEQELAEITRRRRLLLASLGLMAFLVAAGSYFVARAVQKELAVARLQSDFVSAVSHEFRTPLTSMRHLTELLQSGHVVSDDRRRQYYDVLAREAERLHRFVETLLNFGRMEAGAEQYRFEREDPGSLVAQIVDEFRAQRATNGRRIEVSPKAALPPARIDREAFARALWNLLDNAAKYSPDDAPIEVELGCDVHRITVSVRDYGTGIPAAERKGIFQKFVRGTDARESGVKGTGVGLAMVQHIVRAHGGVVRLTSEVGRGSTFTMEIPNAEKPA